MSSDPDHCCGNCKYCKTVAWWVTDTESTGCAWVCTRKDYYVSKELNDTCEHYINKFLKVRK